MSKQYFFSIPYFQTFLNLFFHLTNCQSSQMSNVVLTQADVRQFHWNSFQMKLSVFGSFLYLNGNQFVLRKDCTLQSSPKIYTVGKFTFAYFHCEVKGQGRDYFGIDRRCLLGLFGWGTKACYLSQIAQSKPTQLHTVCSHVCPSQQRVLIMFILPDCMLNLCDYVS